MYFNAGNMIKKKLAFGVNENSNNDKLNIAYGIDKNFILGCSVSITSILLFNKNFDFSFHIFTNYINNEFSDNLNKLAHEYKTEINVYLIEDKNFSNLPTTNNWTIATYFRFIIADYFYKKIHKILYLDADIICNGTLNELFSLKFNNNICFVVKEKDQIWWNKCAVRLDEKEISSGYFNAGMLLIDLEKWGDYAVSSKALQLLSDKNLVQRFTYLDQDVLNLILLGQVIFIDKKFNQQININYELKSKSKFYHYLANLDDSVLIHYIGPTKPWHKWAQNYDCVQYFLTARKASPYKKTPLCRAFTPKQLRYCAKHKFHQKKIFTGLIYFIKYIIFKMLFKII